MNELLATLFMVMSIMRPPIHLGMASWYGEYHHGKTCASGEIFDMNKISAAHKTLPFNTRVKFTYPKTGKSLIVRINDRGPYWGNREFDLSKEAAKQLGLLSSGVDVLAWEILK
jgi:rare lipoprotein A